MKNHGLTWGSIVDIILVNRSLGLFSRRKTKKREGQLKTRWLFLFSMILVLLWVGLGCSRSQPTATPAAPTQQGVISGGTLVPIVEGFMPPTADTPRIPVPPAATPAPGRTGPTIVSVRVTEAFEDHIQITWITNVPTSGRIEYGFTTQYGLSSPYTEGLTLTNGFELSRLEKFGKYHARVRVKDAAGNETVTPDMFIEIYAYTVPGYWQEQFSTW